MRDALYPNMPDSSGSVIGKDAAGKLLTKKKVMAYLTLAIETMKLLRLWTPRTQENELLDESHMCQRLKIRTMPFQEIAERLNMCCVLWKMN